MTFNILELVHRELQRVGVTGRDIFYSNSLLCKFRESHRLSMVDTDVTDGGLVRLVGGSRSIKVVPLTKLVIKLFKHGVCEGQVTVRHNLVSFRT